MFRVPRRKILLPDGSLTRLRLPDSFEDTGFSQHAQTKRSLGWVLLIAWLGLSGFCAWLGEGSVQLPRIAAHQSVVPEAPKPATLPPPRQPEPRLSALPKAVPLAAIKLPVHGGGHGAAVASRGDMQATFEQNPLEADFPSAAAANASPEAEAPAQDESPMETFAARGVAHTGGGCEQAYASSQAMDFDSPSAPDLNARDFAPQLEDMRAYARCNVPSHISLQICAAVRSGRAFGATVITSPSDSSVAHCVAQAVAGLRFPLSDNPDLVRTRIGRAQ